VMDLLFI